MSSLLIVEDEVTIREILFELFSDEHTCFQTDTAEEALKILESEPIDVVLTDISMPGMSGLELLGHTRQRWPNTKVIMISGIRDREYAGGLVRMGAFDYLVKPFELVDIKRSVARATEEVQPVEPAPAKAAAGEDDFKEKPVEVFSSIQLDKAFPLHELLEMGQRNRMTGYMKLSWDNTTIEKARSMDMFKGSGAGFDEALQSQSASIYLRDGLIIDAVVGESETSIYWSDAEEALAMLVRLATWVSEGVCASGYTVPAVTRPVRLSVSSNSGKFLSIVASEEEGRDAEPDHSAAAGDPRQNEETQNEFSEAVFSENNTFDEPWLAYTA
ncbi:MAG: response regulator [bacterium]